MGRLCQLLVYTEKLGFEVQADVTLPETDGFRWLTVGPPKARGVEFTEAPEKRPYGIDSGFRDPSGNSFRLTQVQLPAAV